MSYNRKVRQSTLLAAFGCMFVALNVQAQDADDADDPDLLNAQLRIELRHDDNIYRSTTNEKESQIILLSPRIFASSDPSKHHLEFEYNGRYAWYEEASQDNYDDHELRAGAYLDLGRRSQLDFVGVYTDGHENRGTGLTEGVDPGSPGFRDGPDTYKESSVLGRFTYGKTESKGQLVFQAGQEMREYTNHRDRTRFFDRDEVYGSANFHYRIMPDRSLVLDLRVTEVEYSFDRQLQPSLDNTSYRYLVGTTWDVTGKTSGTVKVGYLTKVYKDSARGEFSGPNWEVNIRWSPRSYSHFVVSTERYPSEITAVSGDFIDNTTYSISWRHEWSYRWESRLSARYWDEDFRASVGDRNQQSKDFGFTLTYLMRDWISWDIGADVLSRDSNIDRFDFDATVIRAGVVVVF